MPLHETIAKIVNRPKPNNEANTIDRIVFPILMGLGWDVHHELDGPAEVEREYTVGKKQRGGGQRADIALLGKVSRSGHRHPVCLIEAKSPTQKLDDHISQLLLQAVNSQVGMCVLTNGWDWSVHLPFVKEGYRKAAATIDLENNPEEAAAELESLLGKSALYDGSAKEYAKQKLNAPVQEQLPRESVGTQGSPQKPVEASTNRRKLRFQNGDEPQLIEKPSPTASMEDIKRWEANEEVCKTADSLLELCEEIDIDWDIVPFPSDFNGWVEWQFDKAFVSARQTWLNSNEVEDDRFDEDHCNDELGEYFSYSHFYNTRERFEAVLQAERFFNEIMDKLKTELGVTYLLYSDCLYVLMAAISFWSGKQDDNGFMAARSTLEDLMSDDSVSTILKDLCEEFSEAPENTKTQTPIKPKNTDPLAFTFLGEEYHAKSKIGVPRELLSLVHQLEPVGLDDLEGETKSVFISRDENEFNRPEQIPGSHYYFERDWYAETLLGFLYESLYTLGYDSKDLTINYPPGTVGIGDLVKLEYSDYEIEVDRSQKRKIIAANTDTGDQVVIPLPSPKPMSITLLGETSKIKFHTDAARIVCEQMLKLCPQNFHRLEYSFFNRKHFISKDSSDLWRAGKIPETDYYLDSVIFSQTKNPKKLDLAFARMMSAFEYTLDDYSVNLRWHVKK